MQKVIDQMGRECHLPKNPQRIVSLVPSQTELLYDLGLGNKIVGQTIFCVHPYNQFKAATKIGGTKKLQMDKIRKLKPDLIIGNKEENDRSQLEQLEKEFPVWMSDIYNLQDSLRMIEMIGDITGTGDKASIMTNGINSHFNAIKTGEKLSALYFIWREPWMVAGKNTFINEMLACAGFENAWADKDARYPEINAAEIAAADPDVILLSSEPYPFKEQHIVELNIICPGVPVLLVDGEMFSWYGSRLLLAADYFRQLRVEMGSRLF
jgi:ABC-type Fe3+-hydroxamate transport system substrate-binding protein